LKNRLALIIFKRIADCLFQFVFTLIVQSMYFSAFADLTSGIYLHCLVFKEHSLAHERACLYYQNSFFLSRTFLKVFFEVRFEVLGCRISSDLMYVTRFLDVCQQVF